MRLFRCATCPEKDKRIADLKERIEELKELLSPKPSQTSLTPLFEADAILSGHQHMIEAPALLEDVIRARKEEVSERDRLLSGSY